MNQSIPGITISLDELVALRTTAAALNLQNRARLRTTLHGDMESKIKGRGMDFSEVRTYQAGDDIRYMDWRVTARTGVAHTKVFHEERERPVYIIVDFSPSMFFATRVAFKSVIAAKVASLLAWAAILGNDKLGGFIYTAMQYQEFPPKARQQGIMPFLQTLSKMSHVDHLFPSEKKYNLEYTLTRLRRVVRPGSLVCLISDFHDVNDSTELHLKQLARHNEMLGFMIRDPIEIQTPPPNRYGISNGETIIEWDCRAKANRDIYEKFFQDQLANLEGLFQRHRIPWLMILTDQHIEAHLSARLGNKKYGYVT